MFSLRHYRRGKSEAKNQVCILLSLVLTRLSAAEAYVYQVAEDEVEESSDLEVEGEFFDEEGDSDDDSDDEVVPVRLLDDFTIYDTSTNQVVPTASLLSLSLSGASYSASGIVRRWLEEDDDWSDYETEEEDDTESDSKSSRPHHSRDRVKLAEILGFNVHDITHRPKKIELDGYATISPRGLVISV